MFVHDNGIVLVYVALQTMCDKSIKSVPARIQGSCFCIAFTSAHCCFAGIDSACVSQKTPTFGFVPTSACANAASVQLREAQASISNVNPFKLGSERAPALLPMMMASGPRTARRRNESTGAHAVYIAIASALLVAHDTWPPWSKLDALYVRNHHNT